MANRQWVLSKPLISLAGCVNPELEKNIGTFLNRLFEVRDDSFDEGSWEILMAKSLVEIYSRYDQEKFLSIDDIKERFVSEINKNSSTQYNISNTKIGMLIVELGFSKFKTNPSGAKRGYRISFFDVLGILIRQEVFKIENILKIVSEVSGCKYNDDKIKKWYTDTYLTPYTLHNNEKKEEFIKISERIHEGVRKKEELYSESDTLTPKTLVLGVGKEKISSKFSDSEIKKAGYSDQEIKDFHKEGIL